MEALIEIGRYDNNDVWLFVRYTNPSEVQRIPDEARTLETQAFHHDHSFIWITCVLSGQSFSLPPLLCED